MPLKGAPYGPHKGSLEGFPLATYPGLLACEPRIFLRKISVWTYDRGIWT
jgi:hypothetical protein